MNICTKVSVSEVSADFWAVSHLLLNGKEKLSQLFFVFSFTFSTWTSERELCFSQLWNTVPWQSPFCGSMILRLVATQMPGLSSQAHTVLSAAEYFWNASVYRFFHLFFGSDAFCEAAWARLLSPELVAWLFQALGTHIPTEGSGKDECSKNVGHQIWKHMQYLYWYITFSPAGVGGTKKA